MSTQPNKLPPEDTADARHIFRRGTRLVLVQTQDVTRSCRVSEPEDIIHSLQIDCYSRCSERCRPCTRDSLGAA